MTISATTQGLRPGVTTSSNRPASPFEGQMIYETDTDLTYVYGGSAWQQVAGGTAVGNSGLVYVGSVSASSTTIALDSVFTSTYDNYRVVITTTSASVTGTTLFRFRASGSAIATSDYYYGGAVLLYNAVPSSWYAGTATSFPIIISSGAVQSTSVIDLSFPMSALRKQFIANSTHAYSNYIGSTTQGFVNLTASTYDGLQITQDAGGTLTGTITVYGYRKP